MDTIERAADAAKYGQIPLQPVLDLTIPTMMDSGLAPPGKHLVAVDLYFVPNHLESADWATARRELESRVIKLLEIHAPGISESIIGSRLFTPDEYAKTIGLPDGDPYHGQMGLDQLLFMRPVPQASRYETPIQGFYLCGAGSHPGGGLTGAPGYNAAQKIIQDYIK
jgi:phytoene dehydrogenase-like protein